MKWTKETPSTEGWYWLRSPGGSAVRVVEAFIADFSGRLTWRLRERSGEYAMTDYAGYSFAGPIPEPTA